MESLRPRSGREIQGKDKGAELAPRYWAWAKVAPALDIPGCHIEACVHEMHRRLDCSLEWSQSFIGIKSVPQDAGDAVLPDGGHLVVDQHDGGDE